MSSKEEDKGFTVVDRRMDFDSDDEDACSEVSGDKPTYVAELEARVEQGQRQIAEVRAQYRAAVDEFDNTMARQGKDAAREIRKGRKMVLTEMIEVLDNLERALQAAVDDPQASGIVEGVKLVRDQFLHKLEHLGVRRLESLGATFDPQLHQAVSTVPVTDPAQDGKVVGIVSEGFTFEDELLRPASVAVGKA